MKNTSFGFVITILFASSLSAGTNAFTSHRHTSHKEFTCRNDIGALLLTDSFYFGPKKEEAPTLLSHGLSNGISELRLNSRRIDSNIFVDDGGGRQRKYGELTLVSTKEGTVFKKNVEVITPRGCLGRADQYEIYAYLTVSPSRIFSGLHPYSRSVKCYVYHVTYDPPPSFRGEGNH